LTDDLLGRKLPRRDTSATTAASVIGAERNQLYWVRNASGVRPAPCIKDATDTAAFSLSQQQQQQPAVAARDGTKAVRGGKWRPAIKRSYDTVCTMYLVGSGPGHKCAEQIATELP